MKSGVFVPGIVLICVLLIIPSLVFGIVSPDQLGTLHIVGSPSGMEILIDGKSSGNLSESGILSINSVMAGSHTLHAFKDGYQAEDATVNVLVGLPVEVRIDLKRVVTGALNIESDPDMVQLYLDEEYKGITPAHVTGLTQGRHNVLLRLPGYQDWTGIADITDDKEVTVKGTLTPLKNKTNSGTKSGYPGLVQISVCVVACLVAIWLKERIYM